MINCVFGYHDRVEMLNFDNVDVRPKYVEHKHGQKRNLECNEIDQLLTNLQFSDIQKWTNFGLCNNGMAISIV